MNFAGFLEMHARGDPGRVALVDARHRLSFSEADRLANRFASAALASGLREGERVAVYLPNRVEAALALLGAMKAGLIPVPLNWRLTGPDLARPVAHCAPALALTTRDRAGAFEGACRVLDVADAPRSGSFWEMLAQGRDRFESVGRQPGEIANLMYTSGTTSTPKAAIHTHGMRLAIASAMAQAFALSRRDVGLAVSPLFHTSGMSVLSNCLIAGAPCILVETWDLDRVLHLIGTEGVSFRHIISTLVVDIVAADPERFEGLESRVRMTWGGGHSVDPSILLEYERRIGGVFIQGYARTEGGLAYNRLGRGERGFSHHGFANRNSAEVAIFDPATGRTLPDGATGEIAFRGEGVSPGYWDGAMIRRPVAYDGGWQPTGDLGFLDPDGALHFLGRTDHMIKTGGENVYPAEIEAALLDIPGVSDAVVTGLPDPRLGQRVAAVVVRSDPALDAAAIEAGARARLGGFKIPRTIRFVADLPRLGTQKVDIRACRDLLLAGNGSQGDPDAPG